MIKECKSEIDLLQQESKKPFLFIKGLFERPDESCSEVVTRFFKEIMKIEDPISIENAFCQGKDKNSRIQVKLTNPGDKGKIFKCAKNLKDVKNENDDPFQINESLTAKRYEEKLQARRLLAENEHRGKSSTAAKLEMSVLKVEAFSKQY